MGGARGSGAMFSDVSRIPGWAGSARIHGLGGCWSLGCRVFGFGVYRLGVTGLQIFELRVDSAMLGWAKSMKRGVLIAVPYLFPPTHQHDTWELRSYIRQHIFKGYDRHVTQLGTSICIRLLTPE